MSTRTLLITLLASALTLPALAQDATPPAEPTAAEAAVTVEGAAPTASTVSRDRDTLSVDFPDEDIKTILRNVADLFELNLVLPDTLTGKTSIKLRDVTWEQIFTVVLSPVGFTYVREGNIIKVVSNDTLMQEPTTTEVIIINNAKADDIRPTIAGLIDSAAGGKIEINARSNALIITERPSRMNRIYQTIQALDKATAQVMIESQFVEVTDRDVRNIGVNWASLQGVRLGAAGLEHSWDRSRGQERENRTNNTNNSVGRTENDTTVDNETIAETSNVNNSSSAVNGAATYTTTPTPGQTVSGNINYPAGNVTNINPSFVTGTVSNPTNTTNTILSNDTDIGSETRTNNQNRQTTGVENSVESAIDNLMGLTNTGGTNRLTSAVFSASDFNIIVSALKTQNNTKVVSNPTVVTLNNTEAVLNIGSEFPIPSYTYNSERGTFEVSGFQYKPIGIIMKVTPQVNGQGVIRLNLEPEVSQQNGETTFGGAGGATIPIIATRKVKTQISLKDGYTAGIGGLVTSNKNHGGTKVPVLGDIPGLGRLFSSKSVNDQTTNLLIFITAKTVNPDGAAPSDIFTADALNSVGMADKK